MVGSGIFFFLEFFAIIPIPRLQQAQLNRTYFDNFLFESWLVLWNTLRNYCEFLHMAAQQTGPHKMGP